MTYPFCGWTARLCGFESLVLTIVLKTGSTEFLGDMIIQLYSESDQYTLLDNQSTARPSVILEVPVKMVSVSVVPFNRSP